MNLHEAMTRYRTLVVDGREGLNRSGVLADLVHHGFLIRQTPEALHHIDPTQPFRELLAGPGRLAVDGSLIRELVYGPLRHGRSRVTWIQALDFAEAVAERDGALLHIAELHLPGQGRPSDTSRPADATRHHPEDRGNDRDGEAADAHAAYDRVFRTLAQHVPVVRVNAADAADHGPVRPGSARRRAQHMWIGRHLTVG
ncbi:hypothetical protein [Streptomyces sp. TS71-3]|uniref:hypothetical protein n=1 Tax=Streptomyces sp. TS71-3 TaxID=2733862 RepID=UPI001B289020|nr:hypothetical protein [Streptomyces sp. TS71-3]GHJ39295.1 hypothetical protein Sm713_49040 [Streptomyces sp. TS71-3]